MSIELEDVHLRCSRKHVSWVLGGIAPFWLFMLILCANNSSCWFPIALLTLLAVVVYASTFWISVRLRNGELIYRSLFGFKRRIAFDEILRLKWEMGGQDHSRPDRRVVIVTTKNSEAKSFDINAFFFSREDIQFLMKRFGRKKQGKAKARKDAPVQDET